jgi:polysaccharide biosynthesis/export protein
MLRRSAGVVTLACGMVMTGTLAGCNLPRGAAFEAEVLAARNADTATGQTTDFAVYSITNASLALLDGWPSSGARSYDWIRRQAQPASLLIAPGDMLSVSVWDAEENSLIAGPGQRVAQLQDTQVSAEGAVFLPFVGQLRVQGMSASTARERIEERYAATIPSAQVQVSVTPGRANTAALVAGVSAPGVYPLADRDVTVLGLLSLGGGVLPGLLNPQIRLFRGADVYGTSVARLYEDPALDTTLVGGDRVIIEAEDRYFLSLGAAGSEALHLFPKDHVSALDALSIIGGIAEARADPQGILILRQYPQAAVHTQAEDGSAIEGPPQTRVVFTIDLTSADGLFSAGRFAVMPGDLVYATESPVTSATTILGLLGASLNIATRL